MWRPSMLVRSRDDYSAIEAVDAKGSRPTVVPQGSSNWPGATLKFTVNEARAARPGNVAMLGRLTELMFFPPVNRCHSPVPHRIARPSQTHRGPAPCFLAIHMISFPCS
jgi:hypothetical protein